MLEQIVRTKDLIAIVKQAPLPLQQRTRKHNLVEQIPLAAIAQRPYPVILQGFPPRIVELLLTHLLHIFPRTQRLQALIHWVIIQVAHDNQLQMPVFAEQRILQSLHLAGSMNAVFLTASTRRPMVDYKAQALTGQAAVHHQEPTGQISSIALKRSGIDQLRVLHLELERVIQQSTINAPLIRPLVMHIFILSKCRLFQQVIQDPFVLHFRHTNASRSLRHFPTRKL